MAEFFMTQKGYDEAVKRLEYLQKVKRAEIVERIQEARSHGDLSENAEYDAARNEQAANEGEINELDYKIKNAKIVLAPKGNQEVTLGTKVTVWDDDLEEETTYAIMGTLEADPMKNIISNESPIGAALLGHKVGDKVEITPPNGDAFILEIKNIEIV